MAGSFGQFRLPTTRPWQRPITLLGAKAAKPDGGRMSTRLLAQQRIDALDKARSRRLSHAGDGRSPPGLKPAPRSVVDSPPGSLVAPRLQPQRRGRAKREPQERPGRGIKAEPKQEIYRSYTL